MTRYQTVSSMIAAALVAVVLTTGNVMAEDAVKERRRNTDRTAAGELDSATTGSLVRASQLIGMNIQNDTGDGVGEINDLVVDGNSGKIRYAAVTYGGFLGVGNKMFAVPFEAFKVKQDPDDADEHVLILNVTQKQLEGAAGFDEDHWPDFADKTFTGQLDKRYGVERDHRNR